MTILILFLICLNNRNENQRNLRLIIETHEMKKFDPRIHQSQEPQTDLKFQQNQEVNLII